MVISGGKTKFVAHQAKQEETSCFSGALAFSFLVVIFITMWLFSDVHPSV